MFVDAGPFATAFLLIMIFALASVIVHAFVRFVAWALGAVDIFLDTKLMLGIIGGAGVIVSLYGMAVKMESILFLGFIVMVAGQSQNLTSAWKRLVCELEAL